MVYRLIVYWLVIYWLVIYPAGGLLAKSLPAGGLLAKGILLTSRFHFSKLISKL